MPPPAPATPTLHYIHYIRFQSPTRSPGGAGQRPDPRAVEFPAYGQRLVRRHVPASATAWFKSTADELLARVPGYLDLLAAHDVACVRLTSPVVPGRVVHEDEHQIVTVPTRPA
ncbi:hypothetical protein [Streptomyces sp. NBC_01506]|uniref:hypothetical protein n=1 Tax=Streptomyces sp. NBC_01506 TaxID=2903887 RepID=UPI003865EB48